MQQTIGQNNFKSTARREESFISRTILTTDGGSRTLDTDLQASFAEIIETAEESSRGIFDAVPAYSNSGGRLSE